MVLAVALWEVSNVHVRIVRRQVVRRRAATFAWAVVLAVLCLRISAATMPRTPTNPWTCVAFVVYATTFIPITLAFLVMGGRLLNNILHRRVFSRLSSAEQRSRKLLAQRIRWCGVATLSFTILQICYVVGVAQQRPLEDDYMYITTMGSHLAANVLIFAQVVCVRTYSDADRRRPTMSAYVGPPRVVVSSPEPPPTKCLHGAASCIS
ncbi:hypothetical protein PBRA_009190 [Plasmodiophora brassicae]|nr:hypothetical protein PBRA_009190 [Plasmodiophora brassicae]